MKHKYHNNRVWVTSISSIAEFHVTRDLQKISLYQDDLNKDETLTEAKALKTMKFFPNVGDIVLAKFSIDSKYYRARILEDCYANSEVKVSFLDFGNSSKVTRDSLLPLPERFRIQEPFVVKCAMFGAYSVKDETVELFKRLTTGRSLLLQVMKEDFQKKLLEVDLVREEDDDVKYTSVRDCLVFIGGAVFETNPYAAVPNEKDHQFEIKKLLKPETEHEVFLSHIADICPGKNLHFYVQVVSPDTMQLPLLQERLNSVYGTRRCEELWNLVGVVKAGLICAVEDVRQGGWFRAQVLECVRNRMVIVRYVDFGNEELVPEHRLRRLLNDFLELPALAASVYIPVKVDTSSQSVMIQTELRTCLLYQEFRMKVRDVSSHGRLTVDLITLQGIHVSDFIEILKEDQG